MRECKHLKECIDEIRKMANEFDMKVKVDEQGWKVEQERDELQAQVAVLRMALDRARKGFVNLIDLNLLPSEEYEKDANKIAQCCFEALSDTPTDAAERVQKLVEALEATAYYIGVEVNNLQDVHNGIVQSAVHHLRDVASGIDNTLSEWRRDKCS